MRGAVFLMKRPGRRFIAAAALAAIGLTDDAAAQREVAQASVTTYGERNPAAPKELDVFAFLIGKWEGAAKVTTADGTPAEIPVTWIGRYILDGMAIADEGHSIAPDGSPALGISLRQFDSQRKAWIVEFLNVSNSFLRRQVNADSGSVTVDGNTVVVVSEAPDTWIRENYRVESPDRWTYSIELSNDGGRSWNAQPFTMTFSRTE